MGESKDISKILAEIQTFNVTKIQDDPLSRASLADLAKRLTAILKDPVNRATDLVFKVGSDN